MAEILIPIPPWLVDGLMDAKLYCETALLLSKESVLSIFEFLQQQNNALWFLFSLVVFWPVWVYFAVAITTAWAWMFWLLASVCLGIIQVVYVSYQFVMIVVDVMVLTLFKTYQVVMRSTVINFFFGVFSRRIRTSRQRTSRRKQWRNFCESAKSYADFKFIEVLEPKPPLTGDNDNKKGDEQKQQQQIQGIGSFRRERRSLSFASLPVLKEEAVNPLSASTSNINSPKRGSLSRPGSFGSTASAASPLAESLVAGSPAVDPNIVQDLGQMTADLLQSTTDRLHEARQLYVYNGDQSVQFLLSGVVKRNHLTLEDLLVSDGRSVAYSGQHEFSEPTRAMIADYYEAVSKGISCMAEAPAASVDDPLPELRERITLVRKMKHNTGRTALMLSGGGAQAMYHLGTVRALIEGSLYDDIKVISGTSGGSITAAMVRHTRRALEGV
jgi:hypothetical protein